MSTPPTSPRMGLATPMSPSASSPRSFATFPLVPPAAIGTHPRHPTRHALAAIEYPLPPATLDLEYAQAKGHKKQALLEFADGSSFVGFSFGAVKSVSGELVFQTGTFSSLLFVADTERNLCRHGGVS
jgi:hypothetical protein